MSDKAAATDLGTLLGFAGIGMRLLLALYLMANIALLFFSGGWSDPLDVAALIVLGSGAVAVASPGAYPLPRWRMVYVLAAVVIGSTLGAWSLSPGGDPGYRSWHFGAATFVLFALALRGRLLWAWIGMGLAVAVAATWSTIVLGSPVHGIELTYGQAASLFAGTFFSVLLRRTAERIVAFQAIERAGIAAEARRVAGARERDIQLAELRQLVDGPLTAIADGTATAADRAEHRLIEAALRDRIRGGALARDPLASAVREARRRGVDATLLDDAGAAESAAALAWVAERVTGARESVTVRLGLEGGHPVVSVGIDGEAPATMPFSPDAVEAQQ